MGASTELELRREQLLARLVRAPTLTITNRSSSVTVRLLAVATGLKPTYAEVMAGTAIAPGASLTVTATTETWYWVAATAPALLEWSFGTDATIEPVELDLRRYVFLGSTNSPAISMVVVLYDATGLRVFSDTLVPTTTVASLPKLVYDAGQDWPETAVGGKVISISSGTVYYDIYGDGEINVAANNVNSGVIDGDWTPTSANMEAIAAGFRFGRIAGEE